MARRWVCKHCNATLDVNLDHVGECPPGGGPIDCEGSFDHPLLTGGLLGGSVCVLEGKTITHGDARAVGAPVARPVEIDDDGTHVGPAPKSTADALTGRGNRRTVARPAPPACGAAFHATVNDNLVPARCTLPQWHDGPHRADYAEVARAVIASPTPTGGAAAVVHDRLTALRARLNDWPAASLAGGRAHLVKLVDEALEALARDRLARGES